MLDGAVPRGVVEVIPGAFAADLETVEDRDTYCVEEGADTKVEPHKPQNLEQYKLPI